MATSVLEQLHDFPHLVLADRCCADGIAQAFVRVAKNEIDLMFCSHHYAEHEVLLAALGWEMLEDIRDKQTEML